MHPDRDKDLDTAKFKLLWPLAYPRCSKIPLLSKFMIRLVHDDILQFGQLLEKAIEVQCKLVRESTEGRDFSNGDDAKCVAVRTCSHGTQYGAPVTQIHAKRGNLLVCCYERKQGKWYFFRIPHRAYKHIPKTSNIEITFELDGTPRIPTRLGATNWWRYRVNSFKELVKKDQ